MGVEGINDLKGDGDDDLVPPLAGAPEDEATSVDEVADGDEVPDSEEEITQSEDPIDPKEAAE